MKGHRIFKKKNNNDEAYIYLLVFFICMSKYIIRTISRNEFLVSGDVESES